MTIVWPTEEYRQISAEHLKTRLPFPASDLRAAAPRALDRTRKYPSSPLYALMRRAESVALNNGLCRGIRGVIFVFLSAVEN